MSIETLTTAAPVIAILGAAVGVALTFSRSAVARSLVRVLAVTVAVALAVAVGADYVAPLADAVARAPRGVLVYVATAPVSLYIGAYLLAVGALAARAYLNR